MSFAAALPDTGGDSPNLAARLAAVAARRADHTAIVERRHGHTRRITFGELSRRVAALAAGLAERGVRPGDRVLLFIPMGIDLYVALLALMHLGAAVVFVDAWAGAARVDAGVMAARPRAFLGIPKAHLLRVVSAAIRRIPIQIVAGGGFFPLERLERPEAATPVATVKADDVALVTFTTGSTGRPKAAARSHGLLWAQHRALNAHLGIRPDDVDLPTLPIFVLNNLAVGATSVLADFDPRHPAEIDPAVVLAQIDAERVTTTSGSPAFYAALCHWCALHGRRLPLRALFTGGAPMPPALARLLVDTVTGVAHVIYGSTEAEPISGIEARAMLAAMTRDARGRPPDGVCVGAPVPQIRVRLIEASDDPVTLDERGWPALEVPAGSVGEIVVSGDHVLTSYLDDPEADRRTKVRDGDRVWHRTGDAARIDSEGRIWLMGRVRWRIRREGKVWWSLPAEVRALMVQNVRHAAYFGMPDPRLGEKAVLVVETLGDELLDSERDRLERALAPMPVDEIIAMPRIPRDPRHESKTDLQALRSWIERHQSIVVV